MTIESQFLKMFQVFTFELLTRVPVMGKFPWIEQNAEMWILWQFSETSKLVTKESEGKIKYSWINLEYHTLEWCNMSRKGLRFSENNSALSEIRWECMGVLMMVTRGAKTEQKGEILRGGETRVANQTSQWRRKAPSGRQIFIKIRHISSDCPSTVTVWWDGGYEWFENKVEEVECRVLPPSNISS